MLKKLLFLIAFIIGIFLLITLLNKNEIDDSYSYDDYEKEVDLIKSNISIDNDISLVKTYDLVNRDRIRLYISDKDTLIFVHSERKNENDNFIIGTVKTYNLEKNDIQKYVYKKDNENVYVFFGYNTDYNKIKFNYLDKYGQKFTQEKNMFKNEYNIITFISDYEGECSFE